MYNHGKKNKNLRPDFRVEDPSRPRWFAAFDTFGLLREFLATGLGRMGFSAIFSTRFCFGCTLSV
jgi:hypothetical protein